MHRLLRAASRSAHLPFIETAEETLRSFTASGRALFYLLAGLLVASSLGLLYLLNESLLVDVPARGGSLTEGIVGAPRFINPVIAASDADRDLAALIYSGLLKATPEGGYVPDLAASYKLSPDGTVYTFTLRPGATFHDGKPVTSADVAFTVEKIQDPALRSPLRASWDSVAVEAPDALTVRFTLRAAYAPFIKNLTLGILPRHLWDTTSAEEFPFSERNASPVGSGPFRIREVEYNSSGIPTAYALRPFSDYALGRPYVDLVLRFYQSEQAVIEALQKGDIGAASGLSPALFGELPAKTRAQQAPLNRVFGVFLNQNQSEVLRDRQVRQALAASLDYDQLVERVLGGFGAPLDGPVPPAILGERAAVRSATGNEPDFPAAARAALLAAGWQPNEEGVLQKTTGTGENRKTLTLSFSLATGNVPELRAAADELKAAWERMGARVEVQVFESGDLSQNVIRPRRYDALLFGEVVGRELDLYPFWHSSQRNDPGLNIALYANSAADRALEGLRRTADRDERAALYKQFRAQFDNDLPAVFLYTPDFVYHFPEGIEGLSLGFMEASSDRFLSVLKWHARTERVWPFFAADNS